MSRDDVICLMEMLGRFRPDYVAWRRDHAHDMASTNGTTPAFEQEKMLDSSCRVLSTIDSSEVQDVLERIETGDLSLPANPRGYVRWEMIMEQFRSHALDARRQRRDVERTSRGEELRFHCLDCLDAGSVLVFYPPFLEWLRPTFEEFAASGVFPDRWFVEASRQWYKRAVRKEAKGPPLVALACRCDSPAAKAYRNQVAAMKESGGAKRAAHVGVWNPERVCRSTGDEAADLGRWYATHRPNESFDWQPDLMQYAGGEKFHDE